MAIAKYNLVKHGLDNDSLDDLLEEGPDGEMNFELKKNHPARRTPSLNLIKHILVAISLCLNCLMLPLWWAAFQHKRIKDPFLQTYSKNMSPGL